MCRSPGLPALEISEGEFVTPGEYPLPVDPGLLERFLDAERSIEWKAVERPPKRASERRRRRGSGARGRAEEGARLAYYHDETARVEQRSVGTEDVLLVTSGPVGALVLVGESHRRGLPSSLEARNAGDLPEFPEGAIEARWDPNVHVVHHTLPFADVVNLARYALA